MKTTPGLINDDRVKEMHEEVLSKLNAQEFTELIAMMVESTGGNVQVRTLDLIIDNLKARQDLLSTHRK